VTGTPRDVLVVGAGAAGVTTAESLREGGFDGRIRLVGAESHLPYDRPPLSKQILLGTADPGRLVLRDAAGFAELDVELRLGRTATGLDLAGRQVFLDDGAVLDFGALVVATGVRPRRLPSARADADVRYLRTLDDARSLRESLVGAETVVVVGAGFLGVEVASAARGLGAAVTVVEPMAEPMQRQFGPVLGAMVRRAHEAEGTGFRLGVGVLDVRARADGRSVVDLTDGTAVTADVVVAAIGSVPDVEWLAGSGLDVRHGVRCDDRCRAAAGVWVAGDVAAVVDPGSGAVHRSEHRTNAAEQGDCVAANLLGADRRFAPSGYFWSDQAGLRLQAVGAFPPDGELEIVAGELGGDRFVATARRGGTVTGVLGWNAARDFGRWRRSLGAGPDPVQRQAS
jgi:3-phenylpropionate/trans-cinnamate dioxygenase ferredoxin reductase component